jgi:glucokinase
MAGYSIGVDLGGTNLRAAAVSATGEVLAKVSSQTHYAGSRDLIISDMVAAIEGVRAQVGSDGLQGVGVGIPGYIEVDTGIVIGSANLPSFVGFSVRDELQRYLNTPVILENDANAATLGEMWMGAGRGVDELILLTLGTGIGGGIIVGGRILRGHLGMAGEFGHMTVIPEGNPCGCGNHGCLEKHASATAIIAMARMLQLGENVTARDIYNMAVGGNERAQRCFKSMGCALGIALANLINAFNFPLYLLSGGVLAAWDLFYPPMMEEIRERSYTFSRTSTRIEKATLGNEAGLIGAAYLPLQHGALSVEQASKG